TGIAYPAQLDFDAAQAGGQCGDVHGVGVTTKLSWLAAAHGEGGLHQCRRLSGLLRTLADLSERCGSSAAPVRRPGHFPYKGVKLSTPRMIRIERHAVLVTPQHHPAQVLLALLRGVVVGLAHALQIGRVE